MEQMEQPQPKPKKSLRIVPAKKKKAPRIASVPLTQEQRNTASQHIWQLFYEWERTPELSDKTIRDMRKEVRRWTGQIINGKARDKNLEAVFAKKAEIITIKTMSMKSISTQRTMDALQELITLHADWQQNKPFKVTSPSVMLSHVRKIIHEIEHGYIEDVEGRFNSIKKKE